MTPGAYREALDAISQEVLATTIVILRWALRPSATLATRRRAAAELTLVIRIARHNVAELAAQFLRAQAKSQAGHDDIDVPAVRGYSPTAAVRVLERLVELQDKHGWTTNKLAEQGGAAFVRHAEQAGRDLIVDSTIESGVVKEDDPLDLIDDDYGLDDADDVHELDREEPIPREAVDIAEQRAKKHGKPVAWARVATGAETCAFCIMLASRGAVYKARSTAAGNVLRRGQGGDLGYRYHDLCDCILVPVYTSAKWDGKDESERLYKLWQKVTAGHSGNDALNAWRRYIEQQERDGDTIVEPLRAA